MYEGEEVLAAFSAAVSEIVIMDED